MKNVCDLVLTTQNANPPRPHWETQAQSGCLLLAVAKLRRAFAEGKLMASSGSLGVSSWLRCV